MKKRILLTAISAALASSLTFAESLPQEGDNMAELLSEIQNGSDEVAREAFKKLPYPLQIRAQSASRMFTYLDFGAVYHSYDSSVGGMGSSIGIDIELSAMPKQSDYFFGRIGYENSFDLTNLFDAGRSGWNFGVGATYPINLTYFPYATFDYVLESTTGCAGSRCVTVDNDGTDLTFGMKYLAGIDLALDLGLIKSSRDNGDQTGWRIGIDRFMHNMDQNEGAYITYTNLGDSKIEFGWRMRR
ncbi:hypothetical protein [Oceanospirillum sanctuarii]|uniref:hypothetical protein n=1 Tax=Oceanospirillum sanctuarii TaxID=1434821 RepID=UPI000A39B618|nr:hypothetical protein [Oceanospirillum sanctuarii]